MGWSERYRRSEKEREQRERSAALEALSAQEGRGLRPVGAEFRDFVASVLGFGLLLWWLFG